MVAFWDRLIGHTGSPVLEVLGWAFPWDASSPAHVAFRKPGHTWRDHLIFIHIHSTLPSQRRWSDPANTPPVIFRARFAQRHGPLWPLVQPTSYPSMAALQRHLRRYLRTLAQPARLPARGALPHRTTVGTPSRAPSRQLQPLASPHLPDSDSETYPWSSSSPYRRVATAACLRGGHGYHAPEAHSARPGAPGKDSTSSSSALIHRRLSRRAPEAPFGSSSCTRGTGRGAVRAMASGTAPSAVAGEGAGAPAPAPAPGVQQQPAVAAAASGPGAGAEQLSAEPPLWMQKMKVNFCRCACRRLSTASTHYQQVQHHGLVHNSAVDTCAEASCPLPCGGTWPLLLARVAQLLKGQRANGVERRVLDWLGVVEPLHVYKACCCGVATGAHWD